MTNLFEALEIIKNECNKHENCRSCPLFSPTNEISVCGVCATPYTWEPPKKILDQTKL